MTQTRAVVTTTLAAVILAGAAGLLYLREAAGPLPVSEERLLYLRSGRTADRLFLTFDAVAADVYWMRAIQHYGGDRRSRRPEGRFELLQPLLDLTTTLDPHFNIAYRFGAIFLSMEAPNGPARSDLAIALLEKGLERNPDRWQYAHDIGFVHYWHTGDYSLAAQWFDRASKMTGAPDWTRQLAAVTLVEGGDRTGARQLLMELVASEETYIRSAAERSLKQLRALDAIDELTAIVARHYATTGIRPRSWAELVAQGSLPGIPVDSAGVPFRYDPATGQVSLSPESELLPLPRGLGRR